MQPKRKTLPWARYISISLFLVGLVAVMTQLFARPRAADTTTSENKIEVEFFTNGSSGDKTGGDSAGNDQRFPTSTKDDNKNLNITKEGRTCKEANIDCLKETEFNSSKGILWVDLTGDESTGSAKGSKTGGVIGGVTNLIAQTYNPPASGVYYVADAMQSMGLASPTYAQGYGYYALSPFLRIWRVFRNIVYMIFAILIIIIAIMILFRQQIGSQAAITAQQALPRIVIALILVTFSYAIAGFMIDVMYWIMLLIGSFVDIKSGSSGGSGAFTKNSLMFGSFGDLASVVLSGKYDTVFTNVSGMIQSFMGKESVWSTIAGNLAGATVALIFMIALVFSLFRLLFILMKAYASVLLYTMFSPFFLMMHAIPGTNSFSSWIKKMAANLAPSIIVFVIIVMTGVINKYSTGTDAGFVPPYITGNKGEGATAGAAGTIITMAMLLALPEIVNGIKQKLSGGPGFFEQMASAAGGRMMNAGGAYALGQMRRGAMGLGRFAGREAMAWGAGSVIGAADYARRRIEASRNVDEQQGDTISGQMYSDLNNALSARDTAKEKLDRMQSDAGRRALIGKYEEAGYDTDEAIERANAEVEAAKTALQEKRKAFQEQLERYEIDNKTDVSNQAAIRKAAIRKEMEYGEGSRQHWRSSVRNGGIWKSVTEAAGLLPAPTRWYAREQAYMQRRNVASRNAVNERLGFDKVDLKDVQNMSHIEMVLNSIANGRG